MVYNFIHIPKAAGSSVYTMLGSYKPVMVYCGHCRVADMRYVALVRNPYDRFVSAYFYLKAEGGGNPQDLFASSVIGKYSSIKDFVMNMISDRLHERIIHFRPMHYWICDDNGTILVHRIFKVEDTAAIDSFFINIGLPKLSGYHENVTNHEAAGSYLDADMIRELNTIYSLDFKLFNYTLL